MSHPSPEAREFEHSFQPPLPPVPALELIGGVRNSLDQGLLALGRLDGAAGTLPDTHLLLYTYVRKEAVLSSQIEGTQSTLDDLLVHELGEAPGVPLADVTEVSRYVEAMTHGLQRLRSGFPLSNRLLQKLGIVRETTGRARGRIFAYVRYLDALRAETDATTSS